MLKNVELLKAMRDNIVNKGAHEISVTNGVYSYDAHLDGPRSPKCLVAHAYYAKLLSHSDACELQYTEGFAPYFGCSSDEADLVLYGDTQDKPSRDQWCHQSGKDYAAAIDKLLEAHGHV